MKLAIAVPATAALVFRAWSRRSLTPLGLVFATATAVVHAAHPWSVFFALLVIFFLGGTTVTKTKHEVKERLTHSSSGSPGGEGPRNHIQVLANSIVASVLIVLHIRSLAAEHSQGEVCWPRGSDVLAVGIVANYAAVAADTFSSELGILASTEPRLITAPWRKVPRGTNGGVTATGLAAGLLGSAMIAITSVLLMPFCDDSRSAKGTFTLSTHRGMPWSAKDKATFALALTLVGFLGTLLDSLLGALLQASVVNTHTGRIVEGDGGRKVPVQPSGLHSRIHAPLRKEPATLEKEREAIADTSAVDKDVLTERKAIPAARAGSLLPDEEHREGRKLAVGHDILDNNGVNLAMAATISVGAMVGACWLWDLPLSSILSA